MDTDPRLESILSYLVFHPKVGVEETDRASKLLEKVIRKEPIDEDTQKRLMASIDEKDEKQRLLRLNMATQPHSQKTSPKEIKNKVKTRQLEDDKELDRRIQGRDVTPEAFIQSLWNPEV